MRKHLVAVIMSLVLLGATGCGSGPERAERSVPPVTAVPPQATAAPTATTTSPAPAEPAPVETKASAPSPTKSTRGGDSPRSNVPKPLVGTWDGDGLKISFSSSGQVTLLNEKDGGNESGTVVVSGDSMTLHLPSGVVTIADWEITRFEAGYGYEFFNLALDGASYVRDVPK